jgi:hypothetical protein
MIPLVLDSAADPWFDEEASWDKHNVRRHPLVR